MEKRRSQRELAQTHLRERGILRLVELRETGVTAATASRMERAGEIIRLSRGIYQLPDAELDPNHSLAEAAKRVPKGIVCPVSVPGVSRSNGSTAPKVRMAIGFTDSLLKEGVETHIIEGV